MLPIHLKVQLLRRAGVAVPAPPQMDAQPLGPGGANGGADAGAWEQQVDALFAQHAIERATRSLQQADESMRGRADALAGLPTAGATRAGQQIE